MTASDPMIGRVLLGRYRVVCLLARGGMGVVYLGRLEGAAGFAKPVVIKTIIPQLTADQSIERMFVREARILANLQHPSIVGVLDFGQASDAYLMVLEYVHGYHLGQWGRFLKYEGQAQPVDHAIFAIARVLDALQYAHRQLRPDGTSRGIVHRDISPANVLIDIDGNVKLHDFGIARMTEETGTEKTQDNSFKGTLAFAAPETIQGVPASAQSDLYSSAVVLYQVLTGGNPFRGKQPSETVNRVLSHEAPPISTFRADVPPELDAAISRALSKEPSKRFESAAAFADALRRCRTLPEEAIEVAFAARVRRDFTGPMAEILGLESLEARDRAWRDAVGARNPLFSSPPSSSPTMRVADVQTVSAFPQAHAVAPPVAAARPAATENSLVGPAPLGRPRRRALLAAVTGGVLVAALGAALWVVKSAPKDASNTHFLVVEKQPDSEAGRQPPPPEIAPSEGPSPSTPSAPPAAHRSPLGRVDSQPNAGSSAARLSRAFQQQQGRVEDCFARFAQNVQGQPRIAVRFSIDKTGSVQRAELTPASLVGTGLGSCILGAARATHFPEQSDALTFTIPITARVAQ